MRFVLLLVAAPFMATAHATNYPCSGKKGGVERFAMPKMGRSLVLENE
ncbi:hypothetical protein [Achromobacter agilis]|nr:hypothetical protein [Achromobacter agilis]